MGSNSGRLACLFHGKDRSSAFSPTGTRGPFWLHSRGHERVAGGRAALLLTSTEALHGSLLNGHVVAQGSSVSVLATDTSVEIVLNHRCWRPCCALQDV